MVLKKNRGHYRIKPDKYRIKLGGTTLLSASAVPPKFDPVVVRPYPVFIRGSSLGPAGMRTLRSNTLPVLRRHLVYRVPV